MKISEKKVRNLIRKSLLKERELLDPSTWFSQESESGEDSGCPVVSSWQEVFPSLVSTGIIKKSSSILVLDGPGQSLKLIESGKVSRDFPCSTALNGFGNTNNSGQTSTGLMRVRGKIGEDQPKYTVFKSLSPTGNILGPNEGKKAWVLTRAILLTGLQSENRNVSARAIYIHGTNRERRLGTAVSGGCIRVSNDDVMWIFENIPVGTHLYVLGDPQGTNPPFPCSQKDIYESSERAREKMLESEEDLAAYVRGEPRDIEPDSTA